MLWPVLAVLAPLAAGATPDVRSDAAPDAAPAHGPSVIVQQVFCGDRETIVTNLAAKFGERQDMVTLSGSGLMVEIWVSDSGSWTMLQTWPSGRSCIVDSGRHWQHGAPEPKGDPL